MRRSWVIGLWLAGGVAAWAQALPGTAPFGMPTPPATSPAATLPAATAPAAAGGGASTALPTAAEVKKQVDDGQYREALKSLLRVLDLKGPAAAAYNRPEMLLLRAECQLQIRENAAALSSLDSAAKEARGGNGAAPNPDLVSKALALSALVGKSPGMQYTPKTHSGPLPPKPINILDRAARPTAFKALFDDSLPDARATVRSTQNVTTLQPLLDTAKMIATLRGIEKAGTGDTVESRDLANQLLTRATILLGNSIADMNMAADAMNAGANQVYTTPVLQIDPVTGLRAFNQVPHRVGLSNDAAARLKTIQQNCGQAVSACADLAVALDAVDKFQPIANDAGSVAQKAAKTLNDDYSRMP